MTIHRRSPRSNEEIKDILAKLEESQLSMTAFARQEGFPKATLFGWRKRFGKAQRSSTSLVEIKNLPNPTSLQNQITLEYLGLKIQMPTGATSQQWKALREGLLQR